MAEPTTKVEIKELAKYVLWAETNSSNPKARKAKLSYAIRDGNPRITVFTNDPDDRDKFYGMIYAGFTPEVFFTFLRVWRNIVDGPKGEKQTIKNFFRPRSPDGSPGEKTLLSVVIVGKDEEGINYISLLSPDATRPKVKFELLLNEYHEFIGPDGNVMSKEEGSNETTKATIFALERVFMPLTTTFRVKGDGQFNNKPAAPTPGKATELGFDPDIPF